MFGYVKINPQALPEDRKKRYRELYCGLCRTIKEEYGLAAHMALSFDMVFLILMINGLFDQEEKRGECRCLPHPVKKHGTCVTDATRYAADMSVLLTCGKLDDDKKDDGSLLAGAGRAALSAAYEKAYARQKEKADRMTGCLKRLDGAEKKKLGADECANLFGELMRTVFDYGEGVWRERLADFGAALGRYIYIADAFDDFEKDRKKGRPNPLSDNSDRAPLYMLIAECAAMFEEMPILLDADIIRNILYSGAILPARKEKK